MKITPPDPNVEALAAAAKKRQLAVRREQFEDLERAVAMTTLVTLLRAAKSGKVGPGHGSNARAASLIGRLALRMPVDGGDAEYDVDFAELMFENPYELSLALPEGALPPYPRNRATPSSAPPPGEDQDNTRITSPSKPPRP